MPIKYVIWFLLVWGLGNCLGIPVAGQYPPESCLSVVSGEDQMAACVAAAKTERIEFLRRPSVRMSRRILTQGNAPDANTDHDGSVTCIGMGYVGSGLAPLTTRPTTAFPPLNAVFHLVHACRAALHRQYPF